MESKASIAPPKSSGFQGRNRKCQICRLGPIGSDAREHRRELERGDFKSPPDDCQGPQQGSSIPRVLRGRVN